MKIFLSSELPYVKGYKILANDKKLDILYIFLGIITLGIFFLVSYWFKNIYYKFFKQVDDIYKADYILFTRNDNHKILSQIEQKECRVNPFEEAKVQIFVKFEGQIFVYNKEEQQFRSIKNIMVDLFAKKQYDQQYIKQGLNYSQIEELRLLYGKNQIDIKIPTYFSKYVYNFFLGTNLSQFFIGLCFLYINRIGFFIVITFFVCFNVVVNSHEQIQNLEKLKQFSNKNQRNIKVIRKNQETQNTEVIEIPTSDLVIGDIIILESNLKLTCDLLLLEGNCLVNEALLTGESIPINKQSFQNTQEQVEKKNKLLSGTEVIYLKSKKAKAVVIGSGWNTIKGSIISSVFFAKQQQNKFQNDLLKFLAYMSIYFAVILLLFIYSHWNKHYFTFLWALPYVLLLVRDSFSPVLLFIMEINVQLAYYKLIKKKLYTLKSQKIVEGGAIKQVCFDKTGTLTELGIQQYGFVINDNQNLNQFSKSYKNFYADKNFEHFEQGIICCNSLELLQGNVVGDPLEEILFKQTSAKIDVIQHPYDESLMTAQYSVKNGKRKYTLLNLLDFDNIRRRQSSIIRNEQTNQNILYCKGSSEGIKEKCKPDTIPQNYDQINEYYEKQGLRILSIAYKDLPDYEYQNQIDNYSEFESDLNFLGFLIFYNPLKENTVETILDLKKKDYECCIITGDSLDTAIAVGYSSRILDNQEDIIKINLINGHLQYVNQQNYKNLESSYKNSDDISIIDSESVKNSQLRINSLRQVFKQVKRQKCQIAITGDAYDVLKEKYKNDLQKFHYILVKIKIFARTNPRQKKAVIKSFKTYHKQDSKYVAFVGDGSNDSLALQTANVGLSIGNDESSVSASFFTPIQQISMIRELLIEGKTCLANAYQTYFFSASLQIFSAFFLYLCSLMKWNLVDFDHITTMIYALPLGYYMLNSRTYEKLTFMQLPATLMDFKEVKYFLIQMLCSFLIAGNLFLYLYNIEYRKDYQQITHEATQPYFSHQNHFFIESKLMFLCKPLYALSQAVINYRGYPYKINYSANIEILLASSFQILWVFVFGYADLIFGNYDSIFYFFKRYSRIPEFQDFVRTKFLIFSVTMYTCNVCFQKSLQFRLMIKEFKKRNKKKEIAKIKNQLIYFIKYLIFLQK